MAQDDEIRGTRKGLLSLVDDFDTPEKAYAEAERRIAAALRENKTELDLQLRHLRQLPPSIARCTALTVLLLAGTQVADLTPIADCTALRQLSLSRTQIADLTPIAGCTALTDLWLDEN